MKTRLTFTALNAPKLSPWVTGCCAAALLGGCGGGGDGDVAVVDGKLALPAAASPQFTESPAGTTEYQRHLDAATANAGTEFAGEQRKQWCWSVENPGPPPDLANTTVVPITRIFDDVYFTGFRWVGQYIFKTNQGLFLLDTLSNATDPQTITEPQLQSAGLDPATIFAAMPTHGHADHYGGAGYLQATYRIPIYLGSDDKAVGKTPTTFPGNVASQPFVVTPLSSDDLAPQSVLVGDLPLTLLSTPGHTPGTFSGVIPVKYNGQPYKVVFWGGTGTPNTAPLAKQYLDGTERLYQLARSEKADGTIHTHPFADGSLAKVDAIANGTTGGKNPFLMGNASTLRSLSILRECAAAKVNALDATVVNPLWLTTTTEAVASSTLSAGGGTSNVSAKVRVLDPYGPVANATVTLNLAGGKDGDSCTATTDAQGVAACGFLTTQATQGRAVTASFAGDTSTSKVWLSSAASVAL